MAADDDDAWDAKLAHQMQAEVHAMLRHALANGLDVPPALVAATGADGATTPLERLAAAHAQLVKLVAPARPGTLRLLQAQAGPRGLAAVLGPLDNVRRLTLAAFACVLSFVLISLSPLVDSAALTHNVYELEGLQQLMITGYLLSAAGMGSAFQALFTALGHVSRATYDPVHDASYWIRICLGLVAGLMLAVLVPIENADHEGTTASFGKPILALLGGFSVQLVHRILQRLVDTVQSAFDGDPREQQQRGTELSNAASRQNVTQARIDLAAQLVNLRDQVAKGATPDQLHQTLSAMTDGLLRDAGPAITAAPVPPGSHTA